MKTSIIKAEEYQDDRGNFRVRLSVERGTFTDDQKQIFLQAYKEHGRVTAACRIANVSASTVRKHVMSDPEFGIAYMEAQEVYKDRVIEHAQNLIFEGSEKVSYDRQGNVIATEKVYPIRLIELELKKVDESYRDKREVTHQVKQGVMVAPQDLSIEDWEKQFNPSLEDKSQVIEGEIISETITNSGT